MPGRRTVLARLSEEGEMPEWLRKVIFRLIL